MAEQSTCTPACIQPPSATSVYLQHQFVTVPEEQADYYVFSPARH